MNYAQTQRLRYIEILVDHYGQINRAVIMEYFGVSVPQATKDLKNYMKIAPDNIRYCTSKKAYLKNPEFERAFL
jgi:hypothetical protein